MVAFCAYILLTNFSWKKPNFNITWVEFVPIFKTWLKESYSAIIPKHGTCHGFDEGHKRQLHCCLSVCLSACLPVCLSACLPVCLSVCLSACLPACLSVCHYFYWLLKLIFTNVLFFVHSLSNLFNVFDFLNFKTWFLYQDNVFLLHY